MPQNETRAPPPDDRDARMRRVVADYVREVVLGRDVTPEIWAEAHPDLLPELKVELKKAQLIGLAYQRALADGSPTAVDPDEQPTLSFWRTDVSTLHVRCPHCHNPVDISGDASLVDIVCTTCGSSFSLLCDTLATPTLKRIGHFELVERLGIGGFGTVWKARDTELDRTVAIKIPRAGRLGTPDVEVSFFREARAAAQLKHPGIVTVHEVGRQDDTIYIVSDLVRGVSLSEWLTAAKPTAREAAELCAKIADALHHAHEAGVVHRDLKPSNIMVDMEGAPHIMDFGLARRDAGEVTVTIDGQMLGTPAYMSPEHARGEAHQADRRSDVYSLGVILFQLLTGELPFRGHARMLMLQILRDEPPKPRTLRAGVPRDLQTICLKCLEKQPSQRYATAADLAADLRRYLSGEPILARPITGVGRIYRWCRRKPAVAALAAGLIVGLAAGIWGTSLYAIRSAEGRANLYHRMVRQAQAERIEKKEGYVSRVLNDLKTARWIDTPELDLDLLRQEAIASLGDFRGYDPVTIGSPDRSLTVAAVDPRGELLAIGHQDGRIELHDPNTGASVGKIVGIGKRIEALSFSTDGSRLLCVDANGQVFESVVGPPKVRTEPMLATKIFNVDDDHESFEFAPGGKFLVAYAAIKPSQNVTGSKQSNGNRDQQGSDSAPDALQERALHSAAVWDTERRERIQRVSAPANRELRCVRVSPDGKLLAASANTTPIESTSDTLLLWDVATGKLEQETKPDRGHGYMMSLAFSHDSKFIAFGAEGLAVYRVPKLESYFFYPGDAIMAVAFSPDDQLLSLVHVRDTVTLWSMLANAKIGSLSHPRAPDAPHHDEFTVFSPDGRFLISSRAYSARIWNMHGGDERIALPGHEDSVPTLMFRPPDGRQLASGSGDATVRIWDVANRRLAYAPLRFGGKVQCLGFSPDGQWLATADWSDGDAATPRLHICSGDGFATKFVVSHKLGTQINGVEFSPNGRYLAACGSGMQIWRVNDADAATGEIRPSEVGHLPGSDSLFVKFSPDSRFLAWADDWKNVRIWDVELGRPVTVNAKMHYGWHGFALVEDGLAFVGADLSLNVWDVRQGVMRKPLGEPGQFQSPHIAATPEGDYLVGLEKSDSAALWDVRAHKKLFVFRPERSAIWSLAFDPSGTKLAVGLSDGGVAVWDLAVVNRKLAELDLQWLDE